ncbi:MAG: GIY-YIG nuclease family protein [Desulfopila sp.]|jgi:putative endonuclease|nr:GIY-YIG nuclease family protein [Desulfopila sp.]
MHTKNDQWVVYMVLCSDGTLYTGITNDLQRRIKQHNSPRGGARYTRGRQPVALVYQEDCPDRSTAGKREARLRKLSVKEKCHLVNIGTAQTGL